MDEAMIENKMLEIVDFILWALKLESDQLHCR